MSEPWTVMVAIEVAADDADEAKQKVYEDLWPLYGDKNMEIQGAEQ